MKEIKTYAEFISKKKIIKVKKIVGQKNSQLYQIFYKDGLVAALKKYPPFDFDKRDRLKREFQGLEIMKKNGFKNISKILYYNVNLNIIIFKWLYGKKPVRLDNFDLKQSLNFIKKIKSLSREKVKSFNFDAVESCKSLQDIISQINYKIHDLEKIKSVKLKKFLNSRLKPIYLNLSKKSKLSKMFKMFYQPIKENLEILSPSDFGFHNSIKKSKKIIFIDFEYFGKDDPVKLCADFMLHPGMHLKNEQKKNWLKDIIQIFKIDKYFSRRLRFLLPFYAIRWSLIVLNDFKMKNTNNSYISIKGKKSLLINQANQLKKAIFFCNLVKSEKYKKWLN